MVGEGPGACPPRPIIRRSFPDRDPSRENAVSRQGVVLVALPLERVGLRLWLVALPLEHVGLLPGRVDLLAPSVAFLSRLQ